MLRKPRITRLVCLCAPLLALVMMAGHQGQAVAQSMLDCHGTESGGNGLVDCDAVPRRYAYKLTADAFPVFRLFIGTEDGRAAAYKDICMPAGWDFQIVTAADFQHFMSKTLHGVVSAGPVGNCPFYISFTQAGGDFIFIGAWFNFGFNHAQSSHDVGWEINEAPVDWAATVGDSTGPVHSPKRPEIPTMSTWGMVLLMLLLLGVGTVVVRRMRRRTA